MTAEIPPLRSHLGLVALDAATGRTGILMAVHPAADLDFTDPAGTPWVVFLRPPGGGREWTTVPEAVTEL